MTLESIVTIAILVAFYILGCYWLDHGVNRITRLEEAAAQSTGEYLAEDEQHRHTHMYVSYIKFARFNLISYEDYLKLVITYGTFHLI